MTNAEILIAQEQIRRLKAQYCRFLDTKQWEKWGGLFTSDATVAAGGDGGQAKGMVAGREEIVRWVSDQVGKAVTVHHVFAPEIDIESLSRATGIWAMEDIVTFGEDVPRRPFKSLNGFGHYHETYMADEGRWYIESIRLFRIRQDIT
jgi:SnoaL-like domain